MSRIPCSYCSHKFSEDELIFKFIWEFKRNEIQWVGEPFTKVYADCPTCKRKYIIAKLPVDIQEGTTLNDACKIAFFQSLRKEKAQL